MHAMLSYCIYSIFSLLSNVTFFLFSLFFHFLFRFSHMFCHDFCVTHSWALFPLFIPKLLSLFLPFYPYLYPFFCPLQAFSHSTYCPLSSDHVQLDTIPLRSFNLYHMTKDSLILGKCQSDIELLNLSLPKMVKTPINFLFHFLACIRQFPPTFFPFLVNIAS